MKDSINENKNSMRTIANGLHHLINSVSRNKDQTCNLKSKVDHGEKILRDHKQNNQEIWEN